MNDTAARATAPDKGFDLWSIAALAAIAIVAVYALLFGPTIAN